MEPSPGREDENWLGQFIAGALDRGEPTASGEPGTPVPASWMELASGPAPGTTIGQYRIDHALGRGGMGVVYQAWDSGLKRFVAIKFLSPRLAVSSLARVRFVREAQAAAAINHANVVTIHAIGEHDGLPYFVMEYVAGITLADRLEREGMLERKSILRIGIQIARGLAAAHDQGLIHRDVKPANVLLESGLDRVKITDFGLACVTAERWRLTASGVVLGTPPYMSPEQAAGSSVDHRSDLFGLGSLLYHACAGEPPFPGPNVLAILDAVRHREPRPIRDLNPEIPPALEAHILRLMAKNPADRFASADDLVQALSDELAPLQGQGADRSPLEIEHDLERLPRSRPAPRAEGFEIVDTLDDPLPAPPVKEPFTTPIFPPPLPWWVRSLPAIALAASVPIAAVAILYYLPSWWQGRDEQSLISLLIGLAGLAVFFWCFERLLGALRAPAGTSPPRRRLLLLVRNAAALAILIPAAWIAYREWSAYSRSHRALDAVLARRDSSPNLALTREDVESMIGRASAIPPPSDGSPSAKAIYVWDGIFRSYRLSAEYIRPEANFGAPRPQIDSPDRGLDILTWINDVIE